METAYERPQAGRVEAVEHAYGPNVHVLADPFALGLLARLCSPAVVQPEFNAIVGQLYRHLMVAALNTCFPTTVVESETRMHAYTPNGIFRGAVIDPTTRVVCVDVARAGILPSQICFDIANTVFDPSGVRQDHLIMSRRVAEDGRVIGADISGTKIGGPIDDRCVLFPDPMGATGGSLSAAISYYKENFGAAPRLLATLNLIVTPQFIRTLAADHPEAHIFALRVDRGESATDVLATSLGARWDDENGLNATDYIVPGGGGFGELMNNSWV
ncbi:MAG: uracil phosphoribosyltransferase [Myxococcales bacterium]|nr:uracil phosphoribosyltransferase [Myxococcales bacterium]MCB9520092.1 uracil phosphoribosyltransferase [Myxococcales bacterium]MCB9531818.1 uracil phosphoribosyltransferase [Myxococcales bacterium]